ncbi:hypothetical protein BFJ67_g18111 [Fusarium oxysporum f. sp. cepae]|nr:hypothetical protein BFJ67_g18111 [Fusarium oxysporum f. sp. cepae]
MSAIVAPIGQHAFDMTDATCALYDSNTANENGPKPPACLPGRCPPA